MKKSADIHTQRAVAQGELTITGDANNPTWQWKVLNGAKFNDVKNGTTVNPSQGVGPNGKSVVNDLFGVWAF